MRSPSRSPVTSRKADPISIERFGGGSPELLNRKLNYFTNTINNNDKLNVPLYTDGKAFEIARFDHTLEEAKMHEFSDFILDKRFN